MLRKIHEEEHDVDLAAGPAIENENSESESEERRNAIADVRDDKMRIHRRSVSRGNTVCIYAIHS